MAERAGVGGEGRDVMEVFQQNIPESISTAKKLGVKSPPLNWRCNRCGNEKYFCFNIDREDFYVDAKMGRYYMASKPRGAECVKCGYGQTIQGLKSAYTKHRRSGK